MKLEQALYQREKTKLGHNSKSTVRLVSEDEDWQEIGSSLCPTDSFLQQISVDQPSLESFAVNDIQCGSSSTMSGHSGEVLAAPAEWHIVITYRSLFPVPN